MRFPLALTLSAVLGCAADVSVPPPDLEDYCFYGLRLRRNELAALRASEPFCMTDDDCVIARAHVEGSCGSVELCGEVVHRSTARAWDPQTLGEEMCMGAPRAQVICAIQPSCRGALEPRCIHQRCEAGDDLDELLAPAE